MDTTSHGLGMTVKVASEFGTWPAEGGAVTITNEVRTEFDKLLSLIAANIPQGNALYLKNVKTYLELAGFYAIKGIVKPVGN